MSSTDRAVGPTIPIPPPVSPTLPRGSFWASRRGFLGRAGGAIVGASLAGPGITAAATPAVPEVPELLALGERIGPALDGWRAAAAAKVAARARAEALCPPVPPDLVFDERRPPAVRGLFRCWAEERDVEGRELHPSGRKIFVAEWLTEGMADGWLPSSPKSHQGRQVRRLAELAERHEAARSAAIELSGLLLAKSTLQAAQDAIRWLAEHASAIPPATTAGVLVLAQMAQALGESESPALAGVVLGPALAEAVVRILGNQGEVLS